MVVEDGRWVRLRSVDATVGCTCRFFSVKLFLFCFGYGGVTFEFKLKSKFMYYAYVISSFGPLFFLIVDY